MSVEIVLDVVVIVLLAVSIVYAAILNRRLTTLRESKAEMEKLFANFAKATSNAESGLAAMRHTVESYGTTLQGKLDAASAVAEDLRFLVERGGATADRLEASVTAGRTAAAAPAASGLGGKVAPASPPAQSTTPKGDALVQALRAMR